MASGLRFCRDALNVLTAPPVDMFQIDFRIEEIACGGHYYAEHELEWPEGSFEKCQAGGR